jgi:hypothetical protein
MLNYDSSTTGMAGANKSGAASASNGEEQVEEVGQEILAL